MKFARAIVLAALSVGASLLCVSCHVQSSASFSFDASFGSAVDAGSAPTSNPDASAIASASENAIDASDVDAAAAPPESTPADFSVRFERTACLGTCPMYVVFVNAPGAVRFSSRLMATDHFVDGCASKNIGDQGVAAIRAALAKYAYFSLKNAYSGGPTDAPSAITSVTADHKTKTVNHYLGAPVAPGDAARLDAIEAAIDKISGAADFATKAGALTPCTYTGK